MASWAKQHAGTISQSLNQEYVNWLANQNLPNSKGPMGLHSAEHILTRDDLLNHSYQEKFLQERMGDISSILQEHGYATSFDSSYADRKAEFQSLSSSGEIPNIAERSGIVENENLEDRIQQAVQRKIDEQQGRLSQELISFEDETRNRQREIESYEREHIGLAEDIYESGKKVGEALKEEYPGVFQNRTE